MHLFFFQRRGAISYDSSDQTALYIRMLGKHNFISVPVSFAVVLSEMRCFAYVAFSSLFETEIEL